MGSFTEAALREREFERNPFEWFRNASARHIEIAVSQRPGTPVAATHSLDPSLANVPFVGMSYTASCALLFKVLGPERIVAHVSYHLARAEVKEQIQARAKSLIRQKRVSDYNSAIDFADSVQSDSDDLGFEFGVGAIKEADILAKRRERFNAAKEAVRPKAYPFARRLKPAFLDKALTSRAVYRRALERSFIDIQATKWRIIEGFARSASDPQAKLAEMSGFIFSEILKATTDTARAEKHRAFRDLLTEAAKASPEFAQYLSLVQAKEEELDRVRQSTARLAAQSKAKDPDPTFVFDGKIRAKSETRYSESELAKYRSFIESEDYDQAVDSYRMKFESTKDKVRRELVEANGSVQPWDDVESIAAKRLADAGDFPPKDPRKVFATVPEHIASMPVDPDNVFTAKAKTVATLKWLVSQSRVQVAFSGGKDSSAVMICMLEALKQNKAEGVKSYPIRVLNSETNMENPEIIANMNRDLAKIHEYAQANGLDVEVIQVKPDLTDTFQVAIVGGRVLHTFPNKGAQCSDTWKVKPMNKLREAWAKEIGDEPIVTVTGIRSDESIHRGSQMKKRADSSEAIVVNKNNHLMLAPISGWTQAMVWEVIHDVVAETDGLKKAGADFKDMPYATDMTDTLRIYNDAAGACSMKADAAGSKASAGGCGARHGCWSCTKVGEDKSMVELLKKPEYGYMQVLWDIRQWIYKSQFDMSKRHWVSRSINPDGTVNFKFDVYTREFLEDHLKFMLTAQAVLDSQGNPHKVHVIGVKELLAVEFEWSRYGRNTPWRTLELYDEIMHQGARYFPPEVNPEHFIKAPNTLGAKVQIGKPFVDYDPDTFVQLVDGKPSVAYSGLEDFGQDLVAVESQDTHNIVFDAKRGVEHRLMAEISEQNTYQVHDVGVEYFMQFEAPRLIAEMRERRAAGQIDPTKRVHAGESAMFMMRYGMVSPRSAVAQHLIIRRSQLLEAHGLAGNYNHSEVVDRLVDDLGRPLSEVEKAKYQLDTYFDPEPKAKPQKMIFIEKNLSAQQSEPDAHVEQMGLF